MAYELIHALNFNTAEFKVFLFEGQIGDEFVFDPETPQGFEFDSVDEARIDDPNGHELQVTYAVTRHFRLVELQQNGTQIVSGTIKLPATRERTVGIEAYYKAFFKTGLSEDKKAFARRLFTDYISTFDPVSSPDIYEYFSQNHADELSHDDFILTSKAVCVLPSIPSSHTPDDKNLLKQFSGGEVGVTKFYDDNGNIVEIQKPIAWGGYLESASIRYEFVKEYLLLNDGEGVPYDPQHVFEDPNPDYPLPTGSGPLHELIEKAVGIECGEMKRRDYKLVTISSWPEFKVVWVTKRIKIGCDTITISLPKILTRTARIVAYCYVSLPERFFRQLVQSLNPALFELVLRPV